MRRIAFTLVVLLCSAALPHAQEAQVKLPVIGWLSPSTTQAYQQAGLGNPGPQLLRDSLAEVWAYRWKERSRRNAPGRRQARTVSRARGSARARRCYRNPGVWRACRTGGTSRDRDDFAIVCVADDLVGSGLATSLAKPGSNMTGVSILATELDAKKIELLKELLPDAQRFGDIARTSSVVFTSLSRPAPTSTWLWTRT